MNNLNRSLLDKIAASPTAFHAVDTAAKMLDAAGYLPLDPGNDWALTPGGKYYLTANGSTLIAFRLSAGRPTGFMVSASHSDAPCFKLKPGCERKSGAYVQLNTERYGGTLNNTWFDRPLGIAGRVLAEQDGRIVSRLVAPQQDVAIIPSVAPHLNTEANNGFKVNLNVDTFPLCTMSGGGGGVGCGVHGHIQAVSQPQRIRQLHRIGGNILGMGKIQAVYCHLKSVIQVAAQLNIGHKTLIAVGGVIFTADKYVILLAEILTESAQSSLFTVAAVAQILRVVTAAVYYGILTLRIFDNRLHLPYNPVKTIGGLGRQTLIIVVVVLKYIVGNVLLDNVLISQTMTVYKHIIALRHGDLNTGIKATEIKFLTAYHPGKHAELGLILV